MLSTPFKFIFPFNVRQLFNGVAVVVGLLLQLLQHALAGGAVLERELGHDAAELAGLGVRQPGERHAQPQQEAVEAVHDAPVDHA